MYILFCDLTRMLGTSLYKCLRGLQCFAKIVPSNMEPKTIPFRGHLWGSLLEVST